MFSSQFNLKVFIINFLLVSAVIPVAFYLFEFNFEYYFRLLQEDGVLEWSTFWSFIFACILFAIATINRTTSGFKAYWFLAGLSLFCLVFAMEEISWGQRLLGYRPPSYFLAENYQQELNFHNIIDTNFRKIILSIIILGYGVFLPLLNSIPSAQKLFTKWNIILPDINLLGAFAATYILYLTYPIRYSGEIVEFMLGLCFLFTALSTLKKQDAKVFKPYQAYLINTVSSIIVIAFGAGNVLLSQFIKNDSQQYIDAAQTEVEQLHKDFMFLVSGEYGLPRLQCGFHRRVYTAVNLYDIYDRFDTGYFASLTQQGLEEERATFFIDPWNSRYWITDQCTDSNSRILVVYSLGPDRKRQSIGSQIKGDDIGKTYHFRLK